MDIRNGSITAYNGISASLGTSNQFNINKSGTNYLNVFNNGRMWIGSGTPVDAGYQMDIVGTARVSGDFQVGDTGNFSTTINRRTSLANPLLTANYGVAAQMQLTFDVNGFLNITGVVGFTAPVLYAATRLQTGGNVQLDGNNKGVYWVNVTDQYIMGMSGQNLVVRANAGSVNSGGALVSTSFVNGNISFGGSTDVASAQVQVDSTTKGFLPPRMTAAQRTAISTPARGLLVYDISSVTEGLWYYNSGSTPGWQEVLTNTGSQSISGSLSITGSLIMSSSSSFVLPLTASSSPLTGSAYWSGSLLFIWNGTRYMSSSFA
jgi:hypothetical protein